MTLPNACKKYPPAHFAAFIRLLFLFALPACGPTVTEEIAVPIMTSASGCGENGALNAALFGSLETHIDWSGSDLICENMLRPGEAGVRLRFAGDVAGGRLALIVAIPGLERGTDSKELPSKVTITVEGSGRFFSTPNFDSCWTDIASLAPLAGGENLVPINGTLYCVAALGEINGDSAVSIPELTFSTIIEWDAHVGGSTE